MWSKNLRPQPTHFRLGQWHRTFSTVSAKSGFDTEVVDGLKALDLERPIREADMLLARGWTGFLALLENRASS
jgi:hypothetical protein